MTRASRNNQSGVISLRGVRHNNLKNFDLDLPLNQLIVITGLSGSGKSSLAFDTLFAEGQRRYIETFSPYARQFFDRMDKPRVDRIDGIPPAIAIEQRNAVKTTRSTVGTMTEICDYMKLLWPHVASLFCPQCHRPVTGEPPQRVWKTVLAETKDVDEADTLITFDLPLSEKLSLEESLQLVAKQGYQRLLIFAGDEKPAIIRVEEALPHFENRKPVSLTVVQDRVKLSPGRRARFVEACEQAYHFGKGLLAVHFLESTGEATPRIRRTRKFSRHLHCANCDLEFREPTPALFSFNHPLGACPACRGFGRIISIDYRRAIPNRSFSLAEGAVKPWQTGHGVECQQDLMAFCKRRKVPTTVPFEKLTKRQQQWVIDGDPNYGKDAAHQWPRAWYGVKGYFRWLESKAYKMHVRVLLSRYRAYTLCPDCKGARFQPEALNYRMWNAEPGTRKVKNKQDLTLADFYRLPIQTALEFIERIEKRQSAKANAPIDLALREVHARLKYLNDVGLGYLTLDRPTRSLSGGETERVNLTTCLGTRLVNTLFVLDEPSVGLHSRDTDRLVRILQQLRDGGNTVVVVEHEASVMRAADRIVDLGPGHGESGGEVVFQGTFNRILKCRSSLTGKYLSGKLSIEVPDRRPVTEGKTPFLTLRGATRNNLKNITARIPLQRFVCVTGVSGSGKTSLVKEELMPALGDKVISSSTARSRFDADDEETEDNAAPNGGNGARLSGVEHIEQAILVDQSILGKTPRSNPGVYIGAFEHIRELFAQSEIAKQRGLKACAFSFNSQSGQCERCKGAGFEKIEMQFLSDVFIRCPDCDGRRYRPHILEATLSSSLSSSNLQPSTNWSIADLLEATVDEVLAFLGNLAESKPRDKAIAGLKLLQEIGLGYLRVGQPINTLSGGECQRLKLVRHVADLESREKTKSKTTLFLFDEPTTGLHFHDVRQLLQVFQRLVDAGHTVLVIEHNLEVIKSADWIIDLGPEAGDQGGEIIATGPPETIALCKQSHTGAAIRPVID